MRELGSLRLNARMARMTAIGAVPSELRRAIDKFHGEKPIPEWVIFIILVEEYAYYSFYDHRKPGMTIENTIKWNVVVWNFRQRVRAAKADALAEILHRAAGASAEVAHNPELVAKMELIARDEVPPEIRALLLSVAFDPPGEVDLGADPFASNYARLRAEAATYLRGWLGSNGVDHAKAWPSTLPKPADDEEEPQTAPASPETDDALEKPEGEEAEWARLSRDLVGTSTYTQYLAMRALAGRRGCASLVRMSMSPYGGRLGMVENQELWRMLCEGEGWLSPPVLREEPIEPPRRIKVDDGKLVMHVNSQSGKTWFEDRPEQWVTVRGALRPIYDWHAHYVLNCDKRR